ANQIFLLNDGQCVVAQEIPHERLDFEAHKGVDAQSQVKRLRDRVSAALDVGFRRILAASPTVDLNRVYVRLDLQVIRIAHVGDRALDVGSRGSAEQRIRVVGHVIPADRGNRALYHFVQQQVGLQRAVRGRQE